MILMWLRNADKTEEKVELENEIKSEPVEFSVNDRYANQKKKEQNVVLTPSRFEEVCYGRTGDLFPRNRNPLPM